MTPLTVPAHGRFAWILPAAALIATIGCGGLGSQKLTCAIEPTGRTADPEEIAAASKDDLPNIVLQPDELGPQFKDYEETDATPRQDFLAPRQEPALGLETVYVVTYHGKGSRSTESLSNAVAIFKTAEGAAEYMDTAMEAFFLHALTEPEKFIVEDVGDQALGKTALAGTRQRGTVVAFRRGKLFGLVATVGSSDRQLQGDVAAVACGLAVRMDEALTTKTGTPTPTPTGEPGTEEPTPQ